MFVASYCAELGYNVWLLGLAVAISVLGSGIVIGLFQQILKSRGAQKLLWQILAAVSAGFSIWSAHFVAILAYNPRVPVSFDPTFTIASGLIAVIGAAIAFGVAAAESSKTRTVVGGVLLGLTIGAMHYCGMLGYRVNGIVTWNYRLLFASLVIGAVFAAASLYNEVRNKEKRRAFVSISLFVAAILGLHFTGMFALKITPLAVEAVDSDTSAVYALALAIAVMTFFVVGTGAASYSIDHIVQADALKRLNAMALHDGLTFLPNRFYFNQRSADMLKTAAHSGSKLALVMIDLNNFKDVNDQFGHGAGDAVLKRVAECLKALMSPRDFVARLGGDEFAFLHEARDHDDIRNMANALSEALSHANLPDDMVGQVSASLGLAVFPDDAGDIDALVNNADLAMYRAKAGHEEQVCFYKHSMDERIRSRRKMAADLRTAIANEELEVFYQPQVDVNSAEVCGFEALARWRRGDEGYISPAEFISVAEDFRLIDALGAFVLRRACADASRWEPQHRVAVNISPLQLLHGDLVESVRQALQDTGLRPSRLELELTESAVIRNSRASLRTMTRLRELGVELALDDFGTGYSSLSMLRTFPFQKIKLDRSFLLEIETSYQAKAVLHAVVALGAGLGVPVLAEGIETSGQLDLLREAKCGQAQGYLFGRPTTLSALASAGVIGMKAGSAESRKKRPRERFNSAA